MIKILTAEHFNDWNTWYSNRRVRLDELEILEELHENQPIILGKNDEKQIGIVKGQYVEALLDYFPCKIGAKNDEQLVAL